MLAYRKVLVLNKSWSPIGIIPLEKALSKVFACYKDGTPKAKIIDPINDFASLTWDDWSKLRPKNDEPLIQAVNANYRIPEVIQFIRYDKVPMQKVYYNRTNIYARDGNTCQYCKKKKPQKELSLDHVVPKCQGGLTTWENIVVCCLKCNSRKAGRTPEQANMKLMREPKKPLFNYFDNQTFVKSWEQFLGKAYYLVELENDIQD